MIIISKKGTRKIVKGHRYEVLTMYNANGNGSVYLKGIGRYSVSNFTDINGNDLPKTDIKPAPTHPVKRKNFSDLKVGDIIVCESDRYTTLSKGVKYRISELNTKVIPRKSWNGSPLPPYNKERVKFEGSTRFYDYNSWKFRALNLDESRELQLSSVLEGKEESYAIDTKARKIDKVENKDLELIKVLAKSIIDGYRHELSVVEWGCQKSSGKLKLNKDDFKHLLKMPLKDILKIVETK